MGVAETSLWLRYHIDDSVVLLVDDWNWVHARGQGGRVIA